jgi:hypothetical protein
LECVVSDEVVLAEDVMFTRFESCLCVTVRRGDFLKKA